MPIVGLTGGIASGKSVVAGVLRERGIPVVDADQIAREVVAPGSEGLREVTEAFGGDVLTTDGSLDREALAQRVFGDTQARKRLEAITHPRIAQLSLERLVALRAKSDAPYVVYDAPLLVETGAYRNLAALIVVVASEEEQVRRVMARDGSTEEAARARIAAQLPVQAKLAAATHVIHNDASLDVLRERTLAVHRTLLNELDG